MRVIITSVLLLLVTATSASAEEEISSLITGNKYRQLGEIARAFYVMGAVEGIQFEAAQLEFKPDIVMLGGCVGGRTGRQLMAIVDKYTAANPEVWHKPMSTLIYQAVLGGCEGGK